MLYGEVTDVCSEIHIKHINGIGGQDVEFFNFKPGGPQIIQWALKPYILVRVLGTGTLSGNRREVWCSGKVLTCNQRVPPSNLG